MVSSAWYLHFEHVERLSHRLAMGISAHRSTNPNPNHFRVNNFFGFASIEPICVHFRSLCCDKSKCEYYLNGSNIIIINRFKVFSYNLCIVNCLNAQRPRSLGNIPNVPAPVTNGLSFRVISSIARSSGESPLHLKYHICGFIAPFVSCCSYMLLA